MSYCNVKTHLVYGVWLMGDGFCLEDISPQGRGLKSKTLEKNGLVLVEFFVCSRWILGIADSHREVEMSAGDPMDLGQEIIAKPEWSEKILEYCKKYKIKNTEDSEWRIVTYFENDNSVVPKYRHKDCW
jgi:hypothetical protein